MEKDAREIIAENALNEYELAIFRGLTQTRGSKALKTKAISEAVTEVMNGNVNIDGNEMTVAEAVVVKVVGEALANPTTGKLKDLAAIVGDLGATKVEIVSSKVDEELARMALGEADGEE
jgi:hypothetical protein